MGDGNRKNDEIILVLSVGIVFCCRLLYTNLIFVTYYNLLFEWHREYKLLYDINPKKECSTNSFQQKQFTYL